MSNAIQTTNPGRRRAVGLLALGLLWAGMLFGGVLPMWNRIRQNDESIQGVQRSVAKLGEWSAVGGWIEEANLRLEPELNARYEKLFPPDKDLSGLYYEVAQVARRSGVENFDLEEIGSRGVPVAPPAWTDPDTDEGSQMERLLDDVGGRLDDLPSTGLKAHGLRATFDTSYSKLARLLDGLRNIDRSLAVDKLNVTHAPEGVSVNLELVYWLQE